jgi:hypothetical protein
MRRCAAPLLVLVLCFGAWVTNGPFARQESTRNEFRLPPLDEAAQDPTFDEFRTRLIAAVKARDAKFVIDAAVPLLQQRFKEGLALPPSAFAGPAREDAEWRELERVLLLGGSFTTTRGARRGRREFCAPYAYSTYPTQLNAIVESMAGHDVNPEGDPWVILGSEGAGPHPAFIFRRNAGPPLVPSRDKDRG